jgi:hypothetical protein
MLGLRPPSVVDRDRRLWKYDLEEKVSLVKLAAYLS